MTKIFNMKTNPILTKISESVDNTIHEIQESDDSYHLFMPVKIPSSLNIRILRKLNFSINGFIVTKDKKIIEVKKAQSHSYIHVINNTPLLLSYVDFLKKVEIISKTLQTDERVLLNKKIRESDIDTRINNISKISFLDLMKMCNLSFGQKGGNYLPLISLPGGHISTKDKTFIDTLWRELKEEINIDATSATISNDVIYHNIFDKLNEQFYHNLIVLVKIDLYAKELVNRFKPNAEIERLIITDISDSRIECLKKVIRSCTTSYL